MASQNNKGEFMKVPRRMFAPPVAKPQHTSFVKGEAELQGKQEDVKRKGIPALLSHPTGDGVATKPIRAPKAQPHKRKGGTSRIEKEPDCKEDLEMTKDEEGGITDAQFEEIVQSVLQKTLQECMEKSVKTATFTEPNEERSLERDTLGVTLAAADGFSGKKSEVMVLEAEQKAYRLKIEKHSKASGNKDRKEKDEKPEADNGGRKENRKGAPKKKVQGNARVVIDQEEMQEEEEKEEKANANRGSGWCMVWVQCSDPTCEKWRRLSSDTDPSILPEDWSCSQNTDLQYKSCNVPEETWSGSENEVVYAVYIPGSIVWAKQYGYPWWPGIVEADPDIGEYFLFSCQTDPLPSKYHVTFFGKTVTRAWISASMLRNFDEPNVEGNGLARLKNRGDKKNLEAALKMAKEADQISLQERIRMFGFLSRFSGRESPRDHKDVKDHVSITCKPQAKRIQGPRSGNKNTAASNKSRDKLHPGTAVIKTDGDVKKKISGEGGRKSKLAPEASSSLSKKSRRELQPAKAATVPKGSGKAREHQNDQKGFKKSFSVPQCKNTKVERFSSCASSSTNNIVLSSYASKKDSLKQAKTSPMAESKLMLSKDITNLEESNGATAVEKDEEEIFSSQEMAVFAEEKSYSPEDFSLVLFEE